MTDVKELQEMTKQELIDLIEEERISHEYALKFAKINSYSEGYVDAVDKSIEHLKAVHQ